MKSINQFQNEMNEQKKEKNKLLDRFGKIEDSVNELQNIVNSVLQENTDKKDVASIVEVRLSENATIMQEEQRKILEAISSSGLGGNSSVFSTEPVVTLPFSSSPNLVIFLF